MDNETKKKINNKYERQLQKGEFFWPDSIYKDIVMSLGIFILLILLATFIGVGNEPKADPSDTSYLPRPEWYFLFLFKFLALYGQIPLLGKIEFIATVIVPGVGIGLLTFIPFIDRSPDRYYGKRAYPLSVMALMVVSIVMLTLIADVPTTAGDGFYLAGLTQVIAGLILPGLTLIILTLMNFVFRNTAAQTMAWTTGSASVLIVGFTIATLAFAPKPEVVESVVPATLAEQIIAGQDLYSIHCVECHGDDGSVTKIEGVKGLEGKEIPPINGTDVLYTLNDSAMADVIAYGRPNAGMNPFGKAYGGELTRGEIDYIVIFMRYMWDARFEKPEIKPLYPPLAEGEVPSYDVHIAPIVKRYCLSCHRENKENNNYWMDSYENILNSGDNGPNIEAGKLDGILLTVIQGTHILDDHGDEAISVMPPKKALSADVINVWIRWVLGGLPKTAEDASKSILQPTPIP